MKKIRKTNIKNLNSYGDNILFKTNKMNKLTKEEKIKFQKLLKKLDKAGKMVTKNILSSL